MFSRKIYNWTKNHTPTNKTNLGIICYALLAGFSSLLINFAQAQPVENYPNRPITILIPMAAGGTTDSLARIITPSLTEKLGQPIVIDNKPGANGVIGEEQFARAKPDGYVIMMESTSIVINPSMGKLNYDPRKDFIPVTVIGSTPVVVVVNPKVPVNTLQELIDLAKKQPGKLNYSSWGNGSIGQFAGETLKISAKINLLHAPYKSTAQALTDVVAIQVDAMFPRVSLANQHLKSGKLRPLAIMSSKRSAMAPNIPITAELGFPGMEIETWLGVFLPAKTPDAIVQGIYLSTQKILQNHLFELNSKSKTFGLSAHHQQSLLNTIKQKYLDMPTL
jgi:tripartite-type tricarboxylate transporter receptor subunit TctC